MSETCVDDYNDLLQEYGITQEKKLYDDMLAAQNASQPQETEDQKNLVQQYKEFLVFKVYGKGAFGEVTEFYDILKREKVAKKVFTELRDYLVEKDVMDKLDSALGRELNNKLILNVSKYDIENQTIYYRAGNCNLADVSNKMREQNLYWFDNEDQLHYINNTLFDYVIQMAEKQVYHSDLKPVNTVLIDKPEILEGYDLKLIDMGGATYHYSYLVAITITYFPEQDKFDANSSEENRTKAEIYQVGRILQELCLSSIYGKQQMLLQRGKFSSYKQFINYYMQNNEKMRQESLKLIKMYYSDSIYNIICTFLDYKKGVKKCKEVIGKNKSLAANYYQDRAELIKRVESIKMNQMFSKIDRQGEEFEKEMNFYIQFDFDERGLKRVQDIIKNNHSSQNYYEYPLLSVYESIFAAKLAHPTESSLYYSGIKYDQKEKVEIVFNDSSISDFLKLQFFVYVLANYHEQLEKEKVAFMIQTLGYDKENSPYEEAIDKYHKFFIKGSGSIYNNALVKKTINELDKLIKQSKGDEEKVRLFKGFKLNIRVLFLMAIFKEIDNCVQKNMNVMEVVEDGEKLFEDIKGSKYGKDMQIIQLVKGMYLLQKEKVSKNKNKAELEKIREILRECSENMNKVGSPIPRFEKQLYGELAIISNELQDYDKVTYYDYVRQRMSFKKDELPLINDSRLKWLDSIGEDEKKFLYRKELYDEYYKNCSNWFGQDILEKKIFYIDRIALYENRITFGKKFENSLTLQQEQLKKLSEIVKMNDLNTELMNLPTCYNASYKDQLLPNILSDQIEQIIQAEQKNDQDLFSKNLSEHERKYASDIFSSDFKLHFIKFSAQQGLSDFSKAYEHLDYMKDKYLENSKISNDIFQAEIYISILFKNSKKLKKAQKEIIKEELTPIQQHTQQLLDQFAKDFEIPYKPLDQSQFLQEINEWRCLYCEGELKFYLFGKYKDHKNSEMQCGHCNGDIVDEYEKFVEPAYGCKCRQKLQKKDYYICLKCYSKPKINNCKKCDKPLLRGGDIYQNGHQIGGTKGFHCRRKTRDVCQEEGDWRRSHGQNLYCPNCEIGPDDVPYEDDFEVQPNEKKYTICIPCSNGPMEDFDEYMDSHPKINKKYKTNLIQAEKQIKDKKNNKNPTSNPKTNNQSQPQQKKNKNKQQQQQQEQLSKKKQKKQRRKKQNTDTQLEIEQEEEEEADNYRNQVKQQKRDVTVCCTIF